MRRLQLQAAPACCRSGSLAGATIEVWKAWLTGSGTTLYPAFCERRHGLLDRGAGAADDGLVLAVDIGDDDVAVDRLQDPFDLGERRKHGRHPAVVAHRDARHLAAAGADGLQRVVEGQSAGGDQRAVLAQAVAHRHVGPDAVRGQQARQGEIRGQHRRLGDRGLAQIVFGPGDRVRVRLVDENEVAERLARAAGS